MKIDDISRLKIIKHFDDCNNNTINFNLLNEKICKTGSTKRRSIVVNIEDILDKIKTHLDNRKIKLYEILSSSDINSENKSGFITKNDFRMAMKHEINIDLPEED
jgi:hypothetical protein